MISIALCQTNPTVGDLEANAQAVLDLARRAREGGAQLAIFPELALTGYPPRDLLDRPRFLADVRGALDRVLEGLPDGLTALVGLPIASGRELGKPLFNAVAVVRRGALVAMAHKRLLPTYDVFDEERWFEPGDASCCVDVEGTRVGITVCEDAWNDVPVDTARRYVHDPVADVIAQGATLLVNVAASPFTLPKRHERARMLGEIARKHGRFVAFVNQVGGNDDLVFDGASAVFGPDGRVCARCKTFEEDLLVWPGAGDARVEPVHATDEAAAVDALVLGTRDYARKCGFRSAVLGLSGGIDSALVAVIAARALGPANVLGVALPSRYSSQHSRDDARALAQNLGIGFREISIEGIFEGYLRELTPHLDALGPAPAQDVTFENVQSRIRCAVLMGISNRRGHLLLTTGNKSEIAVGYCTLYGDMAGGLAVISDLPKTFVYRVARELNRQAGRDLIPESTLTKAPSAELRPDQTDQDSLPPYDVLDAILEQYVEDGKSEREILDAGFEEATVKRVLWLLRSSEYKRRQMATGLILTRKAFGPGRRMPIAQRWRG